MKNWLDENKEKNKGTVIKKGCDNGIVGYSELPVSFLRGWLRFR